MNSNPSTFPAPDVELLADVPLFQFLDENERAVLAERLEVVRFPAGQLIFEYGSPGDELFIIRSGEVEVFFKDDTGEKIVLEIATHGDFIGELSLLDAGCRSASTFAVTEVEALRMDREDLAEFLKVQPHAALDILQSMGKRLRQTVELLRHTASRNVNREEEETRTWIQSSADWIADFSGSIPFLLMHVVVFTIWLVVNSVKIPGIQPFDAYPFGFLTLAVSLEAIFLSVFVLLSQNRQVAKDRIRSDIEYDVNLKAELEIGHLHEKMDRLQMEAISRLANIERQLQVAQKGGETS